MTMMTNTEIVGNTYKTKYTSIKNNANFRLK